MTGIEDDDNECPWLMENTSSSCKAGMVEFDIGSAPSYVTIISCTLSCLGSVLIILTFLVLKDMRTGSQKIVTLLAIADLISAIGYIVGSANYLHHKSDKNDCGSFRKVCEGQATVTTYSSLVSFLWTVILAFYFFLIIVFKRVKVASQLMILYNIIAWGAPLLIVVPLLAFRKLGYAHFAASNWCFIQSGHDSPTDPAIPLSHDWTTILLVLVGGKFWEILSYIVVTVLYTVIICFMSKTRRQVRNTVLEPRVVSVETRLLLIPIIFILLRFWGTLQFFVSIGTSDKIDPSGCVPEPINIVFRVIGVLQAIGDGGQGWGNAILYIFLSSVIRERLLGEWCGRCVDRIEDHMDRVGRDRTNPSNVQFRGDGTTPIASGSKPTKGRGSKGRNGATKGQSDGSDVSESAPLVPGEKATGYNIRTYDTTTTATLTEGGFGTDISLNG